MQPKKKKTTYVLHSIFFNIKLWTMWIDEKWRADELFSLEIISLLVTLHLKIQ
jgi:hypothetical protein